MENNEKSKKNGSIKNIILKILYSLGIFIFGFITLGFISSIPSEFDNDLDKTIDIIAILLFFVFFNGLLFFIKLYFNIKGYLKLFLFLLLFFLIILPIIFYSRFNIILLIIGIIGILTLFLYLSQKYLSQKYLFSYNMIMLTYIFMILGFFILYFLENIGIITNQIGFSLLPIIWGVIFLYFRNKQDFSRDDNIIFSLFLYLFIFYSGSLIFNL